MSNELKGALVGLLVGILASLAAMYSFFPRYQITAGGPNGWFFVKLDKWTGKAWMMKYYEEKSGDKTWYWSSLRDGQ